MLTIGRQGVAGRGGLGLAHTDSTTEECMDTEHAIRKAVNKLLAVRHQKLLNLLKAFQNR
jgi:hypothetical protein